MSIKHTYAGEMQFRRYSDTSTQGQQVTFSLPDREAMEAFIGLEGKRFQAVFVLVGDDEQPVPPPAEKPLKEGPRRTTGQICQWLVMRSQEPEFQRWLVGGENEAATVERCRELCGVKSRKDIDGNPKAEALFERHIRKPWLAHSKASVGA